MSEQCERDALWSEWGRRGAGGESGIVLEIAGGNDDGREERERGEETLEVSVFFAFSVAERTHGVWIEKMWGGRVAEGVGVGSVVQAVWVGMRRGRVVWEGKRARCRGRAREKNA
jgi:hypothetical protein